jgi:hypothetical protein
MGCQVMQMKCPLLIPHLNEMDDLALLMPYQPF